MTKRRRPKYNAEMVAKLLRLSKEKPEATFKTSEELTAYLDEVAPDGEVRNGSDADR